jgi:hypothetical protein
MKKLLQSRAGGASPDRKVRFNVKPQNNELKDQVAQAARIDANR